MTHQQRMLVASSILTYLGLCVLVLVGGTFLYGQFEAWIQDRPRSLVSAQIMLPQAVPLSSLPSPVSMPTRTPLPSPTLSSSRTLRPTRTPTSSATPSPSPTATLTPDTNVPARIEIGKLGIERAIVPVETVARGGRLEWDADKLFATSTRRDLVGHLEGTANLGQPGNIVLIGHNYNRGIYNWLGVFYSLDQLGKGDLITVISEGNERFIYRVDQTDKVPWPPRSPSDMLRHIVHLTPTGEETLTLATCGGANFAPFPTRLYVTAKRMLDQP